ncbi:uncharacterized protein LOC141651753 [Silene latifolia]|uniref:uncharacterized protein LOC141651753 n=1 Tax=Silene latifolia TaxID=37657 RepID=UPI003D78976A
MYLRDQIVDESRENRKHHIINLEIDEGTGEGHIHNFDADSGTQFSGKKSDNEDSTDAKAWDGYMNCSKSKWKREIYQALVAKNKDGFIDGSFRLDKKDKKYNHYVRCDLLVKKWIINSMESHIGETVQYAANSRELWSEMVERYGQTNALEIYQLKKDLGQITQDNTALIEYYSKLKHAWEDLDSLDPVPFCSCGALDACTCQLLKRIWDRETTSKLIQLLMGLNSAFEPVRTTVLSMDPLPPLNKALGLLQKIERQRQISETAVVKPQANAYVSARTTDVSQGDWKRQKTDAAGDKPQKYYTHCKKGGHNLEDCNYFKICDLCGKRGHLAATCFLRTRANNTGYSRGRGRHNNSGNRSNVYQRRANNVDSLNPADNPLEFTDANVAGSSSQVPGVDQSVVNGIVQNVMQQVYKALSDKSNPAGASSSVNFANFAVDTGASDHMTSNEALMQVLSSKVPLELAEKKGGLYWFDPMMKNKGQASQLSTSGEQHASSPDCLQLLASNACNKSCNLELLHSRLGHSSFDKLRHVINVPANQKFSCETCMLSKLHILPFQRSLSYAQQLFELVHLDLWGPYRTASMSGAKYFLAILDDHSRVTWEQCSSIFQQRGILHQRSIVGRPQQNGRVERKYRHLIETARALRIHANLPIKFWGDSVLTAT